MQDESTRRTRPDAAKGARDDLVGYLRALAERLTENEAEEAGTSKGRASPVARLRAVMQITERQWDTFQRSETGPLPPAAFERLLDATPAEARDRLVVLWGNDCQEWHGVGAERYTRAQLLTVYAEEIRALADLLANRLDHGELRGGGELVEACKPQCERLYHRSASVESAVEIVRFAELAARCFAIAGDHHRAEKEATWGNALTQQEHPSLLASIAISRANLALSERITGGAEGVNQRVREVEICLVQLERAAEVCEAEARRGSPIAHKNPPAYWRLRITRLQCERARLHAWAGQFEAAFAALDRAWMLPINDYLALVRNRWEVLDCAFDLYLLLKRTALAEDAHLALSAPEYILFGRIGGMSIRSHIRQAVVAATAKRSETARAALALARLRCEYLGVQGLETVVQRLESVISNPEAVRMHLLGPNPPRPSGQPEHLAHPFLECVPPPGIVDRRRHPRHHLVGSSPRNDALETT